MLSILSYHDSTKLPQESAKISGLRWAWYLLGCARKHGRKLVPFFSFPAALTVRSSDRATTVRSRIIYRYLIYLCDRPRCQSIRRGNRLETGRGGEERLVIDFPDVEREFCLPGKSFPLLSPYISVESYWRAVCRRPCSTFLRRSSLSTPPLPFSPFSRAWPIFVDDEMETIGSGRETEDESHRKNDEYALNTLFHGARESSDPSPPRYDCILNPVRAVNFIFRFFRSDEFDPSSVNF